MRLFGPDLIRSFVIGFLIGAAGLAVTASVEAHAHPVSAISP
ncbi:hypothetical protein RXV95_01280 [Novosphingobium sp. ZN18A2]